MKFKYIFLWLFLLTVIVKSQIDLEKFNYSVWIKPPNIKTDIIISFNARYDLFIFEKSQQDTYETNFTVQLEVYDSTYKLIERDFIEANVKSTSYEKTISKELYYSNSFMLSVPPDNYIAHLTLYNKNKTNEIEVGTFKFSLNDSISNFPVVIREHDLKILETDTLSIPFTNFVKFSPEKQILLIPYINNIKELKLTFKDSVIDLKQRMSKGLNYIFVSLDSLPLIDEQYMIILSTVNSKHEIPLKVVWLNKPFTIKNLDLAISLMSYIFDANTVKKVKNADDLRKYYLFFEVWRKIDPNPKTAYNELIFEFYSRADEAVDKFKSLTKPNGALTDRGKIYILYGNPSNIDRKFSEKGILSEIWNYKGSIKHQFIFTDENKNGNLILKNK